MELLLINWSSAAISLFIERIGIQFDTSCIFFLLFHFSWFRSYYSSYTLLVVSFCCFFLRLSLSAKSVGRSCSFFLLFQIFSYCNIPPRPLGTTCSFFLLFPVIRFHSLHSHMTLLVVSFCCFTFWINKIPFTLDVACSFFLLFHRVLLQRIEELSDL